MIETVIQIVGIPVMDRGICPLCRLGHTYKLPYLIGVSDVFT